MNAPQNLERKSLPMMPTTTAASNSTKRLNMTQANIDESLYGSIRSKKTGGYSLLVEGTLGSKYQSNGKMKQKNEVATATATATATTKQTYLMATKSSTMKKKLEASVGGGRSRGSLRGKNDSVFKGADTDAGSSLTVLDAQIKEIGKFDKLLAGNNLKIDDKIVEKFRAAGKSKKNGQAVGNFARATKSFINRIGQLQPANTSSQATKTLSGAQPTRPSTLRKSSPSLQFMSNLKPIRSTIPKNYQHDKLYAQNARLSTELNNCVQASQSKLRLSHEKTMHSRSISHAQSLTKIKTSKLPVHAVRQKEKTDRGPGGGGLEVDEVVGGGSKGFGIKTNPVGGILSKSAAKIGQSS